MKKYTSDIGLSAGLWMLKWELLSKHLDQIEVKLDKNEEIDVFINFECIMRNLFLRKGLTSEVAYHKQELVIQLESSILNLIAHYRMFFKANNMEPKVYFYYTDLTSNEPQQMEIYNKYYREYYKNQYTNFVLWVMY